MLRLRFRQMLVSGVDWKKPFDARSGVSTHPFLAPCRVSKTRTTSIPASNNLKRSNRLEPGAYKVYGVQRAPAEAWSAGAFPPLRAQIVINSGPPFPNKQKVRSDEPQTR
jgi:hypothetical protein